MENVLPRFHGYLFLQKQTTLLKSWFVHSAGETDMCKISFFYVGLLTFYSAAGIVASCEGGRCKKYRRAVQWSASLNCSLSQNCHKTFAFSPLIPKQMIADPQTWEEQLVQITSSEWKFSVYIFRPGKQNSYFRKKPYDVVDYFKKMWKVRQKLNWYENVRLKDELQKMQYLYNDHIEVQKLYYIKVTIVVIIIIIVVVIIIS